jgi:hypothetical protein
VFLYPFPTSTINLIDRGHPVNRHRSHHCCLPTTSHRLRSEVCFALAEEKKAEANMIDLLHPGFHLKSVAVYTSVVVWLATSLRFLLALIHRERQCLIYQCQRASHHCYLFVP